MPPRNEGQCGFEGCDRRNENRGLCATHARQRNRGRELVPIVTPAKRKLPWGAAALRDEDGNKRCTRCLVWQPESAFSRYARKRDGLQPHCKKCVKEYGREWWKNMPGWKLHGLTEEWYLKNAANGCQICKSTKRLGIDHDHRCCPGTYGCPKCARGVLCHLCNLAIGALGDHHDRLLEAALYLVLAALRQENT